MSKQNILEEVRKRDHDQPEFLQAAEEVLEFVEPLVEADSRYQDANILARIIEPERVISFRVEWQDDAGNTQVNRGFRVQYSSVLGPYKGGLRFHPSVNLSILKFLGFEQIFKNSLTGLPLGGGKGGSDFDPKGKSDAEVKRFCEAFMKKLHQFIGPELDVPAGDIGVGAREIKYLLDEYLKHCEGDRCKGALTGKTVDDGGSHIRPEATGYGLVYFVAEMLATKGDSFSGKRVLVSGSGNVAQFAAEKAIALGGKVITMSDSAGTIVDESGVDQEKLDFIKELKNVKRGRIKEYLAQYPDAKYLEGSRPWGVAGDIALPCATQNEIDESDAKTLLGAGVIAVGEGANMPSTKEAMEAFLAAKILFSPAKASNAGGVAVSGLEMEQNAKGEQWSREEVDQRLQQIMKDIHEASVAEGKEGDWVNYVKGANIAGFKRVAEAMVKN